MKVDPAQERRAKRMAIAQDVQLRIREGVYKFVRRNGYIVPADRKWFNALGGDLQEHVEEVAERCEVCQLGGLLLSKARLFNNAPAPRIPHRNHGVGGEFVRNLLGDVFDWDTLGLLEAAFESYDSDERYCEFLIACHRRAPLGGRDRLQHLLARLFGIRASLLASDHKADAIVWACMNNLVTNCGEFKPTQKPDLTGFPHPVLEAASCN